jgi:methylase of polypeptide subunit release factors
LFSEKEGLAHYEKLFQQIKLLKAKSYLPAGEAGNLKAILEFSPEQKPALQKLIKHYFPASRPKFQKDLAGKWRMAAFDAL